jgi:hypothetical protein
MPRKAKILRFPGVSGRPARPPQPASEEGLVEVHRCHHSEALVIKSLLDSEGIPSLLRSRLALSVHPFTVGSQGEIVVLVPAIDAARSRRILSRVRTA